MVESADGYMIPERLSRFMKYSFACFPAHLTRFDFLFLSFLGRTASVEIGQLCNDEGDFGLEEQMLGDVRDGGSSQIGIVFEGICDSSESEEEEHPLDEEVALAPPSDLVDEKSEGLPVQQSPKRALSRPTSKRASLNVPRSSRAGSKRTSSVVATIPHWLIYHWVCPRGSNLSQPSILLQKICKVSAPLSEVRLFSSSFFFFLQPSPLIDLCSSF